MIASGPSTTISTPRALKHESHGRRRRKRGRVELWRDSRLRPSAADPPARGETRLEVRPLPAQTCRNGGAGGTGELTQRARHSDTGAPQRVAHPGEAGAAAAPGWCGPLQFDGLLPAAALAWTQGGDDPRHERLHARTRVAAWPHRPALD